MNDEYFGYEANNISALSGLVKFIIVNEQIPSLIQYNNDDETFCGIAYRVVAIEKDDQALIKEENISQYYIGEISQLTPEYCYEKGYNYFRQGFDNPAKSTLKYYYPSALKVKDWKLDMSVDEFAEYERPDLWEMEKKRLAEWETMIKYWNGKSEDEQRAMLRKLLARRMGLYDASFNWVEPAPGIIFQAMAQPKSNSKFFSIVPFEFINKRLHVYTAPVRVNKELAAKISDILNNKGNNDAESEDNDIPF